MEVLRYLRPRSRHQLTASFFFHAPQRPRRVDCEVIRDDLVILAYFVDLMDPMGRTRTETRP
jgi:hypothetical protein